MKKIILIVVLVLSAVSSYADCIGKYKSEKVDSYYNRLSYDETNALNAVSVFGGLFAGNIIAGTTLAGGLITMGIATAPITIGIIVRSAKNRKENRMIRLINHSYKYLEDTSKKPKGLLRRLYRKMKRKSLKRSKKNSSTEFNIEELAQAIVRGNEDMSLCVNSAGLKDLKRASFDGTLIELDI